MSWQQKGMGRRVVEVNGEGERARASCRREEGPLRRRERGEANREGVPSREVGETTE